MFPSEEARLLAIESIERSMIPRSLRELASFAVTVLVLLIVPWIAIGGLVNWLLAGWAPRGWVTLAGTLLFYTVAVSILLRRSVRLDLRRALVEAGVPICLACGYQLRGLGPDARACPECGRTIP